MIQCTVCKEFFNPSSLQEVVEHLHKSLEIDKDYFGKKVEDKNDIT